MKFSIALLMLRATTVIVSISLKEKVQMLTKILRLYPVCVKSRLWTGRSPTTIWLGSTATEIFFGLKHHDVLEMEAIYISGKSPSTRNDALPFFIRTGNFCFFEVFVDKSKDISSVHEDIQAIDPSIAPSTFNHT